MPVLIAPQGLVIGELTSSGRPELLTDFSAIVHFDGWLHHMRRNNSIAQPEWYRMHARGEKGIAEADYPAPIIVDERKIGQYGFHGLTVFAVKDGVMFEYFYDNNSENKWFFRGPVVGVAPGVAGPPTIIKGYLPGPEIFSSSMQMLVPYAERLVNLFYFDALRIWFPMYSMPWGEVGWPIAFPHRYETEISGTSRLAFVPFGHRSDLYRMASGPYPYFAEWGRGLEMSDCYAPAAALQRRVSFNRLPDASHWTRMLDSIDWGEIHLLVPIKNKGGLTHFWKPTTKWNSTEQTDWKEAQISWPVTGGAAMIETLYGFEPFKRKGDLFALAPMDNNMFWSQHNEDTGEWSEPQSAGF